VAVVSDDIAVAGPSVELDTTAHPPLRFVEDDAEFPGPMAALAGALDATSADRVIVVAGDMPFLVSAVLSLLLDRLATEPSTAAVLLAAPVGDKRQVLPLALRVAPARDAARSALQAGDRSLVRLLDRLQAIEIPVPEWLPLDPEGRSLVDIDDPADLVRWGASRLRETR
jgi:molybdopterin-guanine dinucleotide biosynthesis protein A